jgi:Secretion system C-terminal sorting domain
MKKTNFIIGFMLMMLLIVSSNLLAQNVGDIIINVFGEWGLNGPINGPSSFMGSGNSPGFVNLTQGVGEYWLWVSNSTGSWQVTAASGYASSPDSGAISVSGSGYEDFYFIISAVSASIIFTNGSSFTPSIISGSSDQAFGRFNLSGDISGASLTSATIKLNGTRTGMSNVKLWSSSNATFESGSDTQLGTTVANDPGTGNSVSFSFTSAISTSGTYYFVTADVASSATGVVQGVIEQNSSLTVSSGTLSGTINNAPLSTDDNSLPIELTDFSVSYSKDHVILTWLTQSETDNLGFNLYRSENENGFENSLSINSILIPGMGTTSTPTNYSFADEYPVIEGHTYCYWLQSVSTTNELELFGPVSIEIPNIGQLPTMTILEANYPNPFNPETTIAFNIKENETGFLSIFNLKGERILKQEFEAGDHQYNWNAEGLSSGVYFYKLTSPTINLTRKMILMK